MRRRSPALGAALIAAACAPATGGEGHDHGDDASELFERAYRESRVADPSCSGVRVPDRPGFAGQVALTFDDGPNMATTPDIVRVLRRYDIPAAFFINGDRVRSAAEEDFIAELVRDPLFLVGNHTWSHRDMTRLAPREVEREIVDTEAVIEGAGGDAAYFRFPFGSSSCSTAEAVRSRGSAVTGWHIDSADWCFAQGTPGRCPESTFAFVDDDVRDDMAGYTLRQVGAHDGGIVLFHDVHRYTADSIESIVLELDDRGYDFVDLDDTGVFPDLNAQLPDPDGPGDPGAGGDEGEDGDGDGEGGDGDGEGGDGDGEGGDGDDDGVTARVEGTGGSGLWLRAEPYTGAEIVAGMPEGASVSVLEGPEGGWYQVRYGDYLGWTSGDYLAF